MNIWNKITVKDARKTYQKIVNLKIVLLAENIKKIKFLDLEKKERKFARNYLNNLFLYVKNVEWHKNYNSM